ARRADLVHGAPAGLHQSLVVARGGGTGGFERRAGLSYRLWAAIVPARSGHGRRDRGGGHRLCYRSRPGCGRAAHGPGEEHAMSALASSSDRAELSSTLTPLRLRGSGRWRGWVLPLAALALWWLSSHLQLVNSALLVSPEKVVATAWEQIESGRLWRA